MQHVHAACETVLPRFVRVKRQCRCAESGQCQVDTEIGEHHVRRAFTVFFAIEYQSQWQTGLSFDDCRTIPTFDFDNRLLHAVIDTSAKCFARREEEPQNGYRHNERDNDGNQSLHILTNLIHVHVSMTIITIYPYRVYLQEKSDIFSGKIKISALRGAAS